MEAKMPELEQTPAAPSSPSATTQAPTAKGERFFTRFTPKQRYPHAVLFTTFLGLAGTGLPLRFSDSIWARGLASFVGGFGAILFFHKFCALVLTIAFLVHVKEVFTRGLYHREKGIFWGATSMVANWKDAKDMFAHMRWFVGLGPRPQFERYAYWEKFDYWAVFWGMMVMVGSGFIFWFPVQFAKVLPTFVLTSAQIVHGEEATLAAIFLFVVHFYNVHLKPSIFPMNWAWLNGQTTLEYMKDEHAAEYERTFGEGKER
jgi:cytochrome b subunit of formate dehydrogenase